MVQEITKALSSWFQSEQQSLPWRGVSDPYAIWLSEIMLQQTRIATVIPYWQRFLKNYPDPVSLAKAPVEEVLEMWAGLGYYSRGRNLHAAARQIVENHDGIFPTDPELVRKLPGIGEYTTAAICSIAFASPLAVIDGNVERVLCRYLKIDGNPKSGAARKQLKKATEDALDHGNPGDHNQALMDLGRTICTPRSPDCPQCPLASGCQARASGDPTRWPTRQKKRPTEQQWWASAVVLHEDQVLVWISDGELLAGHRGPPLVKLSGPGLQARELIREEFQRLGLHDAELIGHADHFQHAITYRKLEIYPLVYRYQGEIPTDVKTVPISGADRLPALHRKSITAASELVLEDSH